MAHASAIDLIGIEKRFGDVHANKDVTLSIARGSIHGIVGENGAGKSTLMSILYGFYEADRGSIRINGENVVIRSPKHAIALGIGMVHQHFMLVDPLSVLDNIMLGAEGGWRLAPAASSLRAKFKRIAADYGLSVNPDAVVADLPVGLQQRVEILKALVREAQILILDEPTAVLTPDEADHLFALLRVLRDEGKTILLITHKLEEIMHVTDHVSVMRRGALIATYETAKTTGRPTMAAANSAALVFATYETAKTNAAELAAAMVGRPVLFNIVKGAAKPGKERLVIDHLTICDGHGQERVHDLSFAIRAGEILGLAGVSGNGQSEVLEALAGLRAPKAGRILMDGVDLVATKSNPSERRAMGLLHIPEDRLKMGLVSSFSAAESMILGFQSDDDLGFGPMLDPARVLQNAEDHMRNFDVRPQTPHLKTAKFSGGNQQKLVLAREIEHHPKVLLVGQPTRGVDVGAIEFIHKRLIALRDAGVAILLVSVELSEILSLSDRIIVMCDGRITGERTPETTHERDLGLLMAGVKDHAA